MSKLLRIAALAGALASTLALGATAANAAVPTPHVAPAGANAAAVDGVCYVYDNCLYYNSGYAGAVAGFDAAVPNYAGYYYPGPGAGAGLAVKNDAASDWNADPYCTVTVWYNSNYAGVHDVIGPNSGSGNRLAHTYNENASQNWAC
jgi:hypothetical protein